MSYKAFEDFYKEAEIKHLILHQHKDYLISPPFATDLCKEYSRVLIINNDLSMKFIDTELPPATSKYNSTCSIGDSVWMMPYGIWDAFNVVLELKNSQPIYHYINKPGMGQFYSVGCNGKTAFSFPLGYSETAFAIYINNGTVTTIDVDNTEYIKRHMGTVFCNGSYWSAPRSDTPNYVNLVQFDGKSITNHPIDVKRPYVTRKYTDIVVKDNILYALPFGEQPGMTEVIEFNTDTNCCNLYELDVPDFAKKFNAMVLVGDNIIGLPYGDKDYGSSNWGVSFNTNTKKSTKFNIGEELAHGGKYRYRTGIDFNNSAIFFPGGTPGCPIIRVNADLSIDKLYIENYMLGRPIKFQDKVVSIAYHMNTKEHFLFLLNDDLSTTFLKIDVT